MSTFLLLFYLLVVVFMEEHATGFFYCDITYWLTLITDYIILFHCSVSVCLRMCVCVVCMCMNSGMCE